MATIYPQREAAPRTITLRPVLTLEQLLYLAIGVSAVLLHLVALGTRALHHDETLHAQFSWRLYTNGDYVHDPLLHGPFLYYMTAGIYLLFGDSNTTARLSAAFFGIALTLLPALLRRQMGRGAALLASAYLLISPIALYIGRFLRHDIFAVVFELLAVAALARYIESERPGWHYLLAAAAALMLTTMETFYLFLLIVGSFVGLWLLWQVSRRALSLMVGYVVLAGAVMTLLPRLPGVGLLPIVTESQALEVRNQPDNNWEVYLNKVGGVLGPFLHHPAIIVLLLLTAGLCGGLWFVLWGRRDSEGRTAWRRAADDAEPGTLVVAVDRISGRQWSLAFLLAFAIYGVLYTGFLSNVVHPNVTGLLTGVSGSFLYWLGQHSVRRGGQPAHFYLFELGLYEPLLLLTGVAGVLVVLRRWWVRVREQHGSRPDNGDSVPTIRSWSRTARTHQWLFLPSLLAWWSLAALAIYSWAGEKMPWLTLHLVLPLALLGAWAVARLAVWALRDGFPPALLWIVGSTGVLMFLCLLRLSTVSMANAPQQVALAAVWPISFVVLAALGAAGGVALWGLRGGVLVGGVLLLLTLVPFTVRSALRLSFETGDVPVEPMVFVQTSPDVPRVMVQLDRAQHLYGSARQFGVRYDNETVWQWYLRNTKPTTGSGGTVIGPVPPEVQVVFLLAENEAANQQYLSDWVAQRYPLRWWLPECEIYRFPQKDAVGNCSAGGTSLLSRLLSHPLTGQNVVDWWQFAMYRKVPAPLGSSDWILYMRPEVADLFDHGTGKR